MRPCAIGRCHWPRVAADTSAAQPRNPIDTLEHHPHDRSAAFAASSKGGSVMASLRSVRWALVFACGFTLVQAGCVSPGTDGRSLPADGVLLTAAGEPLPAATGSTGPAQAPQLTAEELDQLVAPIALYPDALVAQVLSASTYPTEIVEADRRIQEHAAMKGEALAQSID